jgi:hypothetical protein
MSYMLYLIRHDRDYKIVKRPKQAFLPGDATPEEREIYFHRLSDHDL